VNEVRENGAIALGKVRAEITTAVPALARTLKDESPKVRSAAAEALGKFGADAKAAAAELGEALKDSEEKQVVMRPMRLAGSDPKPSQRCPL